MKRRGIILAGGTGTRLHPVTKGISKQLLPIYDKPMVYYPLSVLMMAGIQDILIITTPEEQSFFQRLLGDGSEWGINLSYAAQPKPEGLAQAFIIGEHFIGTDPCALALGDNIFYGHGLTNLLQSANQRQDGATIFVHQVKDPQRYGVATFDQNNRVINVEEKPQNPKSHWAVTGLYFYGNEVVDIAKSLKPSPRGELEITDVQNVYLGQNKLHVEKMGRGYCWFDTGLPSSLIDAGQFIQTIQKQQGQAICCPEEIAFQKGWIDAEHLQKLAQVLSKNEYGAYLQGLLD